MNQSQLKKLGAKRDAIQGQLRIEIHKFMQHLTPLTDNEFWGFIDTLKKQLMDKDGIMGENVIRRGIHNFFCDCHQELDREMFMLTMTRFVKTYEDKSDALYNPLFKRIEGCGDDTYGDILDSFPLHGRKRYERALRGQPTTRDLMDGETIEYDEVYLGENYIRMILSEGLEERASSYDEDDTEAEDTTYHVVVQKSSISRETFTVEAQDKNHAMRLARDKAETEGKFVDSEDVYAAIEATI